MRNILICFVCLCFASCIKDGKTNTFININNSTNHFVKLIPFRNGSVDSSKIRDIPSNASIEIENRFLKGKTKQPVVLWDYFENLDSIIVFWDNIYPVTHMLSDTFYSTNKYIQFNDNRNIGLSDSYSTTSSEETKISINWQVTYSFTEQDYQYAQ